MSSETFAQLRIDQIQKDLNFSNKINSKPNPIKKSYLYSVGAPFSLEILPESPFCTMIKSLIEYRNQNNIINSVLSINAEDLDLVQKLNYCSKFLAHIPFSLHYNKTQTKILLDFFHLEEEMDLIANSEI